ncbi:MAG TPA: hypothetical protein VF200_08335 [Woeseiaceae bacterium]
MTHRAVLMTPLAAERAIVHVRTWHSRPNVAVQDLMAHTDPDMTRAYQKGHARKVLRVDMMLPFSVEHDDRTVREEPVRYDTVAPKQRQEIFSENFLTKISRVA